jgi:hypothetical protein
VAADGADGVADDDRSCAVWPVGAADDVLAIDETGFVKKRIRSAEGQWQYSGAAGGSRTGSEATGLARCGCSRSKATSPRSVSTSGDARAVGESAPFE